MTQKKSVKTCFHCGKKPGTKPGSNHLWNGFLDKDTKELVCFNCRKIHYQKKSKSQFEGLYTEFPVYAVGFNE